MMYELNVTKNNLDEINFVHLLFIFQDGTCLLSLEAIKL